MALVTRGFTFTDGVPNQGSAANLHALVDGATVTGIQTADITDGAVTNAKVASGVALGKVSITTGKIAFGVSGLGGELTVGSQLQTAGSTLALANGTSAQFYVCNGSGVPTLVALSGDATLANTGAVTLATTGVTAASYGSTTLVPVLTFDAKGRCTAASTVAIPTQISKATSSNAAIPAAGATVQITHGLSAKPLGYTLTLVCTATDNGFTVGDEVPAANFVDNGLVPAFRPRVPNGVTTYVEVRRTANPGVLVVRETDGTYVAIDTTKWALKTTAWV